MKEIVERLTSIPAHASTMALVHGPALNTMDSAESLTQDQAANAVS